MDLETANYILGLATLKLQIVTVALFALYLLRHKSPLSRIASFVGKWGVWLAFLSTFVSSALTLYYSEVIGIEPCPLCWWQRVFLYSQVVLLGIALWKKNSAITMYSIGLSISRF